MNTARTITPNQEAVILIESAKSAVQLGPKSKLRKLRLLIHPDRFGRDAVWAKRAEAAMFKLDKLYNVNKPPTTVKVGNWVVINPITKGDIADLYLVESKDGKGVLKIAQSVRDNDLIEDERATLKKLHESNSRFSSYLPKLFEGFTASNRAVNVISLADGYIPLTEIASLTKLDFRHVVWMMNRALSVLGFVHQKGVVHGAITPEHLLYSTVDHNLCLVDWCYASTDKPIKAIVKTYKGLYPPEVIRKQKPSPATDIFMLATVISQIADIPKQFKPLFELCMVASPASRPVDAWEFQDRWKKTAEKEYGPPTFVPLILPVN